MCYSTKLKKNLFLTIISVFLPFPKSSANLSSPPKNSAFVVVSENSFSVLEIPF